MAFALSMLRDVFSQLAFWSQVRQRKVAQPCGPWRLIDFPQRLQPRQTIGCAQWWKACPATLIWDLKGFFVIAFDLAYNRPSFHLAAFNAFSRNPLSRSLSLT
jgi:hypothetical protein